MLVQINGRAASDDGILHAGTCFSCGNNDRLLDSVRAMDPGLQACSSCILKHGREELRLEANRVLAWMLSPENRKELLPTVTDAKCGHCGKPVEQDPHTREVPIVCGACWEEATRRFNR